MQRANEAGGYVGVVVAVAVPGASHPRVLSRMRVQVPNGVPVSVTAEPLVEAVLKRLKEAVSGHVVRLQDVEVPEHDPPSLMRASRNRLLRLPEKCPLPLRLGGRGVARRDVEAKDFNWAGVGLDVSRDRPMRKVPERDVARAERQAADNHHAPLAALRHRKPDVVTGRGEALRQELAARASRRLRQYEDLLRPGGQIRELTLCPLPGWVVEVERQHLQGHEACCSTW